MKFEWELIFENKCGENSFRAKVFGGWIVKDQFFSEPADIDVSDCCVSTSESMIFIPDANHEWVIED